MNVDKLKKDLQDHLTDGLVTVIGTGLSVAEGMPGMAMLKDHLLLSMPGDLVGAPRDEWGAIEACLKAGKDIESVLQELSPTPQLESVIVDLTTELIANAEASVITEVISGTRTLRFTKLLRHMLRPNTGLPVVTTNYDRLVEVASERAGLGVDTLFVGHHVGELSQDSHFTFCRRIERLPRHNFRRVYRDRVVLLKPHGSLDWYLLDGTPVRCPYSLPLPRLIITPGLNKYQAGYHRPFDTHRERANLEIDRASRYLIIGYGFNDDHLQTHLTAQLRSGKPAVVLTRTLSDAAVELIRQCPEITAISADPDASKPGAWVISDGDREFIPGPNLWDVNEFVKEVFEP